MGKEIKNEPQQPEANKSSDTQFVEISSLDWRLSMLAPVWRPPADVYETDEMIIVRVEIAGMKEDHFTIELNGRLLSIRGSRQDPPERRAFHQMEIRFGEFHLEMELPFHVEANLVEATYSNGFLRVSLPKSRPRQIPIVE